MKSDPTDCLSLLAERAQEMQSASLNALVNQTGRLKRLGIETDGMFFDFSKHLIDEPTLEALVQFSHSMGLDKERMRYFKGDKINVTEHRSVLHTALRRPASEKLVVDGEDVVAQVHDVLNRLTTFCDAVHGGSIRGHSGERFTDVVNIGIGGSDLGPAMAYQALWGYHKPDMRVHYVSNIDGAALTQTLKHLRPERTLFIIASKTFTTQETLTNAHTARRWFVEGVADESAVAKHFVAVSTNESAVVEFGISPQRMFEFWDWVGGRFSVWSSIGLSLMLGIGSQHFRAFLDGGYSMDRHFESAPLSANAPVVMALLGFWYGRYFDVSAHAVLPYDEGLGRLPAFLQQGEMESNGKSIDRSGQPIQSPTCPVLFGEAGTNGQHAFYQLLHQGTHLIPADFILPITPHHELAKHHEILASHCFAQAEALMNGRDLETVCAALRSSGMDEQTIKVTAPHRVFTGNRPSTTILLDGLTPRSLGQLVAAYEHKIFTQGVLWNVFSYDQWGVELGKALAKRILPTLSSEASVSGFDSSTQSLIARFRKGSSA
jgi:glucose-6-phosphate isomerase